METTEQAYESPHWLKGCMCLSMPRWVDEKVGLTVRTYTLFELNPTAGRSTGWEGSIRLRRGYSCGLSMTITFYHRKRCGLWTVMCVCLSACPSRSWIMEDNILVSARYPHVFSLVEVLALGSLGCMPGPFRSPNEFSRFS